MHDAATMYVEKVKVESAYAGQVYWFDVRKYDLASVQLGFVKDITAVIELVYANRPNKLFATLFSPTRELGPTTSPTTSDTERDIDVTDVAYLGARIKTAGASSELVDLLFYATSVNGTGLVEQQVPILEG
jgi:hypothetical protein